MPRRKGRFVSAPADGGHRPGARHVAGRAPGQLPAWARISLICRGRRSLRFESRAPASDGPEQSGRSAGPSVVAGDMTPLSPDPASDRPLDFSRASSDKACVEDPNTCSWCHYRKDRGHETLLGPESDSTRPSSQRPRWRHGSHRS